jgi:3,4-dihydroxy 2-butanone 4-phosphate synthase/GTP cyclohydrolase II
MRQDGSMARLADLTTFAAAHGLPILTIQDIIVHRMRNENLVEPVGAARLPSAYADAELQVRAFRSTVDGSEHLALIKGEISNPVLVRIHSECLTGDALGSLRCDCGAQLQTAIRKISDSSSGVLVYLRGHEGRGIGLANKIRAYALQDEGHDTVEANAVLGFEPDVRDYGIAAQILRNLGVRELNLLSNNPRKAESLERYGLTVVEQRSLKVRPSRHNARYLATKRDKLGHQLEPDFAESGAVGKSAA